MFVDWHTFIISYNDDTILLQWICDSCEIQMAKKPNNNTYETLVHAAHYLNIIPTKESTRVSYGVKHREPFGVFGSQFIALDPDFPTFSKALTFDRHLWMEEKHINTCHTEPRIYHVTRKGTGELLWVLGFSFLARNFRFVPLTLDRHLLFLSPSRSPLRNLEPAGALQMYVTYCIRLNCKMLIWCRRLMCLTSFYRYLFEIIQDVHVWIQKTIFNQHSHFIFAFVYRTWAARGTIHEGLHLTSPLLCIGL